MAYRLGWIIAVIALFYGFAVLGGVLWLRRHLTPDNLATSIVCQDRRHASASTQSQRNRDGLVLLALDFSRAAGEGHGIDRNLRTAWIAHVYLTYWPLTEREQWFDYVAPRLHRCGEPPRGWPWNNA